MSEYLSRPIFDFPINWGTFPTVEASNDIRVLQIGKGAPKYQKLRTFTGTAFEFKLLLRNETEIIAFETFVAACEGRLTGFWIRYPGASVGIKARVDDSNYEIDRQWLSEYWADDASAYLVFSKPGSATQYSQVTAVTDTGNNTETITIDDALTGIDSAWDVHRLAYVRFANDNFALEYEADNFASVTLRVVELTTEYAQTETGQRPVYLYEFSLPLASPVYYRFTSFDQAVTSDGSLFTSGSFEHDGHKQSLTRGESETQITSVYEAANPIAKFFPYNLPAPLNITIYETTAATPDTRAVVFTGRVSSIEIDGLQIVATCKTILSIAGRKFPRFNVQPRCNYYLFDACCRVTKANYRFTATVSRVGINNIEVENVRDHNSAAIDELDYADDYFSFGWVEFGAGATQQFRTISKAAGVIVDASTSTGRIMLALALPLSGVAVGNTLTFYPGCDGTRQTCKAKFANFLNFGGHVMAPSNLSLIAVEQTQTNGNKK